MAGRLAGRLRGVEIIVTTGVEGRCQAKTEAAATVRAIISLATVAGTLRKKKEGDEDPPAKALAAPPHSISRSPGARR